METYKNICTALVSITAVIFVLTALWLIAVEIINWRREKNDRQ